MRRLSGSNRKVRQLRSWLGLSALEIAAWGTVALVVSVSIYLALTVVALLPFRELLGAETAHGAPTTTDNAVALLGGSALPSLTPTSTTNPTLQTNQTLPPTPSPVSTEETGTVLVTAKLAATATATVGIQDTGTPVSPASTPVTATATITATASASATMTATASAVPPTETPTVTETPTETASPTVTATPTLPVGWVFVQTRLQPNPAGNMLLVYGLALNNTGTTQRLSRIAGTFYDAQGQTIAGPDQVSDYWPIEVAPQGGWVPFELTIPGIQDAASYNLSAEAQAYDQTPSQNFEFSNPTESTKQSQECVSATVKNNGADLAKYLKIVVVLFDSNNNVINFSDAYQLDDLDAVAGGQSLDMMSCADPLDQSVARYEIHGWGQ